MTKHDQSRVVTYLDHILEAIQRINEYTDDMTELVFLQNKLVQDAVIRNLEVIGEACRNIDRCCPEFTEKYSDFPLRIACEMRNALAHGYFKVDLEIVWKTIENDLPSLEKKIRKIQQIA